MATRKNPPRKLSRQASPVNVEEETPRKIKSAGGGDSNFFEQVFAVAKLIPRGRVTSYGAIAAALGARSSSRAVGYAMNNSHVTRDRIPAHRVVNRLGILSGKHHFGAPDRMEQLLKKEGVRVKDDKVVDFDKLFWDPAVELGLL